MSACYNVNMLKVSVLIPIWNVEKYIERCLRSVFEQTIADQAEFILVNDCSPDNSMKIAETVINDYPHLKNQIKVINHETNRGSAAARDTLLKNAAGKYFIFVDSDDWVEPNYLEELLNAAEREDADVVGCNVIAEWSDHSQIFKIMLPDNPRTCIRMGLEGGIFSGVVWNKIFKREVFSLHSDHQWLIEGADIGEDLFFNIQFFIYAKKIVYLDKELYHYNFINQNSLSPYQYYSLKRFYSEVKINDEIKSFFQKKNFQLIKRWRPLPIISTVVHITGLSIGVIFSRTVKCPGAVEPALGIKMLLVQSIVPTSHAEIQHNSIKTRIVDIVHRIMPFIIIRIGENGNTLLLQIGLTGSGLSGLPRLVQRWHQHRRQNRNDRNHNQELYQCET